MPEAGRSGLSFYRRACTNITEGSGTSLSPHSHRAKDYPVGRGLPIISQDRQAG